MTEFSAPQQIPLIIDGKDVEMTLTFEVKEPGTERVVHKASSATLNEVKAALDSAQAAYVSWAKSKTDTRRSVLLRMAEIMEERRQELLSYVLEETSADKHFADFGITLGINLVKDVAGKVSGINGYSPRLADDATAIVYKEPYGVMLGIAPW